MNLSFKISFAKDRKPIWSQLIQQKLKYNESYVSHVEDVLNALHFLKDDNIISEKTFRKSISDIGKRLCNQVADLNR